MKQIFKFNWWLFFISATIVLIVPATVWAGDLSLPFWGPLVACQGDVCKSLCDLTDLAQRIIYFGLTILTVVIAPVMLVIGGGMILMAGGSTTRLESGKKILKGAVIGVTLGLLSFTIVATFLWLIGNRASGTRVSWPDIQCVAPLPPGSLPPPGGDGGDGDGAGGDGDNGLGGDGGGCPGNDCFVLGGGDIVFKQELIDRGATKAAGKMADAIYCFDNAYNGQIRITEAYPPTYQGHQSPQHYNGCAIDFTINLTPVAFVFSNSIKPKANACGLVAVNEYNNPSLQATANHIHFHLPIGECP